MSQAKLLIVEDERIEAEAMSAALTGMGYSVVGIAATGKKAIDLAVAGLPDVVLMDIRLKGPMDGIAAAEEIRRQLDIPVIYLTAFADEKTLQRAKLTSPLGYLLKPAQGSEMRSAIEVALVIHEQTRRLAESEARYRGLFDGVPIGLYRTTRQGHLLDANLALVQILGYPDRQTLLNVRVAAIYSDLADRDRLMEKLAAGQGNAQMEMRFRRYDGAEIWVRVRITATSCPPDAGECFEGSIEDITDRRRAEEEAERSRRLLHSAVTNAPILLFVVDRQGRMIMADGKGLEAMDVGAAGLVGRDLEFGSHAVIMQDLRRVLKGDQSVADVHQVGGRTFHLRYTPVHDDTGQVINVIGVATDITEHMRTVDSLRRERDLVSSIAEASPSGILVLDPTDHILFANRRAEEVLRLHKLTGSRRGYAARSYRAADLSGQPLQESQRVLHQVLASGKPVQGAVRWLTWADGTRKLLSINGVPLRDQEGRIASVVTTVEDVTEDHVRQEALRHSEEQNRLILDSASEAILGLDLEGRCTFTNQAALRLLGHGQLQDVLGKNVHALLHHTRPDGTPFPEEECPRLAGIGSATATHTETDLLWRADGSSFPAEVWSHPILQDGQVAGTVVTFLDITERRQSQHELEAIASVATALRNAIKKDDTLAIVLDQILDVFGAAGAAVVVRGPHDDDLTIALGTGQCADLTGATWTAGSGSTHAVLEEAVPYQEGNLRVEAGFAPKSEDTGRAAGACVPLQAEGQTIGALWLHRPAPVNAEQVLTPAETRLLESIASMAANAIRRASLLEEAEQSLRRVGALRAIDQAISGSLDLQVTLDVLLDQALSELGVDSAAVLLLHPGSQQLRQAASRGLFDSQLRSESLRLGEGCAGQAALERRIMAWPAARHAPQPAARDERLRREGFVSGYCAPIMAKGTVTGVLEILSRGAVRSDQEWLAFLEALARQAAIAVDSIRLFEDLQRSNLDLAVAYDTTLEGWSKAMDLRDRDTEGHTQRVTAMAILLARTLGVPEQEMAHFRRGALLHDIGKIGVPDSVLLKTGPLNPEEWAIMRQHPVLAFEMLSPIAYLKRALDIPYCHHEKWDGSGYPRGLKAEQIPLAARVFAVVDVWDALVSDRPYRPAWTAERAEAHIVQQAGIHFDPKVVAAFLALLQDGGAAALG